jgi:hypothetical protein
VLECQFFGRDDAHCWSYQRCYQHHL